MKKQKIDKIKVAFEMLNEIVNKAIEMETEYKDLIELAHPMYKQSAANLVHYLAFRSFDTEKLQKVLRDLGFSSLTSIGAHIMKSLCDILEVLEELLLMQQKRRMTKMVTLKKSEKILRKNTKQLFGYKSKNRQTRIMVTMPDLAVDNQQYVKKMMLSGMNCARINCAHNDEETWGKMILNIHSVSEKIGKKCKIAMDLGGPKLRTGSMISGPKVMHIRPKRDDHGRVTSPAKIWVAPLEFPPPPYSDCNVHLPVTDNFFAKIKRGSLLYFKDSRGKEGTIQIVRKENGGKWGQCEKSYYIETGTTLYLTNKQGDLENKSLVGEILPKEQHILLFKGDLLILHKDPKKGEDAIRDENGKTTQIANISCTLPQVFKDVKKGEPIYFNDGKIEGEIETVDSDQMTVRIVQAKAKGSKLKADKGINLPDSNLSISGLMEKDIKDLDFVAKHADVVNLSFVNNAEDVIQLQEILKSKNSDAGIIVKIETKKAFYNLPEIILSAMRSLPVGIMIARGDLAIETGWKNFATIQQEIMRICEAAHLPVVWATQVLESLSKKGTPSRAEITDAAMSQQTECVMLNKGPYIFKAIRMLNRILKRMEKLQEKRAIILPKLDNVEGLKLSYEVEDEGNK